MESRPGTYVLVLRSYTRKCVEVGRWGKLEIQPGYYLYVGSAFGPGGVRSRVSRHCRQNKARHWHIDYLRQFTVPLAIWYSHAQVHLEHNWAAALTKMHITPITGFGCTDCNCKAHLFYTDKEPLLPAFVRAVGRRIKSCACEELASL